MPRRFRGSPRREGFRRVPSLEDSDDSLSVEGARRRFRRFPHAEDPNVPPSRAGPERRSRTFPRSEDPEDLCSTRSISRRSRRFPRDEDPDAPSSRAGTGRRSRTFPGSEDPCSTIPISRRSRRFPTAKIPPRRAVIAEDPDDSDRSKIPDTAARPRCSRWFRTSRRSPCRRRPSAIAIPSLGPQRQSGGPAWSPIDAPSRRNLFARGQLGGVTLLE